MDRIFFQNKAPCLSGLDLGYRNFETRNRKANDMKRRKALKNAPYFLQNTKRKGILFPFKKKNGLAISTSPPIFKALLSKFVPPRANEFGFTRVCVPFQQYKLSLLKPKVVWQYLSRSHMTFAFVYIINIQKWLPNIFPMVNNTGQQLLWERWSRFSTQMPQLRFCWQPPHVAEDGAPSLWYGTRVQLPSCDVNIVWLDSLITRLPAKYTFL